MLVALLTSFSHLPPLLGDGGASEFCDAFHVLNIIKEEDPKTFEILDSVPVAFWDFGGEHDMENTGYDLINRIYFGCKASTTWKIQGMT